MPNVWTEDDTEKLIIFYEQHQCLWNSFNSEFNNKLSRYEAYKEIKNSMNISGLTICDCIKRIADAKKEYCYELSKITAAIFCEKLYTPKVKWFKRMHTLFFPYTQASYCTSYSKKQDNNEQKFNIDYIQENLLHLSIEKPEDKQICSNDVCGTCEPREIELHLRLRESVHSALKLQDTFISPETIQTIDAAAETSKGVVARRDTQTDILDVRKDDTNERRYITRNDKGKKDCSTCTHDISVESHSRRRIEDSLDIFGKSVAFQLRSIDTQTVAQLQKEIQNLITKARLKILETRLTTNQSSASSCCCDCIDHKIMCEDDTCGCGLKVKECLLLARIKKNKDYKPCYE